MEDTELKAKFTQITAKQGKTVLQFELDEACAWALPDLVTLAGGQVILTIVDTQMRFTDKTGEPEPVGHLPGLTDGAGDPDEYDI